MKHDKRSAAWSLHIEDLGCTVYAWPAPYGEVDPVVKAFDRWGNELTLSPDHESELANMYLENICDA